MPENFILDVEGLSCGGVKVAVTGCATERRWISMAAGAPMLNKAIGFAEFEGAGVQSLSRGLQIFDFVLNADGPVRMVDVAERFGIDKSAAYRFLSTLERHGLLSKDGRTKAYTLGPHLWQWASKLAGGRSGLVSSAKPILDQLAAETQHTAHLAVLEADRVLLLEVSASKSIISIRQNSGDLEPLYCSAVGKAVVAFLPDTMRSVILGNIKFERHTESTITTVEGLESELAIIREQGVAFDRCEAHPEICCIAAPILSPGGEPVASIGISMPSRYVSGGPENQTGAVDHVRASAAAARISLFGNPGRPRTES